MGIAIDKIGLADPVILAPMSGVTDMPFRRLVKSFGAGLVVSEMIASEAMIRASRQSLLMARNSAEELRQLTELPCSTGNELGEAVTPERAMRISEFMARGPKPFGSSRSDAGSEDDDGHSNEQELSLSSTSPESTYVAPAHRTHAAAASLGVPATPAAVAPTVAQYIDAADYPQEPAARRRPSLAGATAAPSTPVSSVSHAPILVRGADSFAVAQDHPDDVRARALHATVSSVVSGTAEGDAVHRYHVLLKHALDARACNDPELALLASEQFIYEADRRDQLGRRIIHVVGSRLPLYDEQDGKLSQQPRVSLEALELFAVQALDPLVQHPFLLVYWHAAVSARNSVPLAWFRRLSNLFPRSPHHSNLKALVVVHPSLWLRGALWTLASLNPQQGWWDKLHYVHRLAELQAVGIDIQALEVPRHVRQHDERQAN